MCRSGCRRTSPRQRQTGRMEPRMKMIHTADWHIGRTLCERSLLEDQQYFLDQLITLLAEEQADVLLIAGDLYDRSVPPAAAVSLLDRAFCRILEETPAKILAISGNHDSGQRLSFASSLLKAGGLYIASMFQKELEEVVLHDAFGEVHFFLMPYFDPAAVRNQFEEPIKSHDDLVRALLAQNAHRFDPANRNVLVAHGFFCWIGEDCVLSDSEISIGGADMVSARCLEPFDYAALGHLHAPQRVGRDTIRYAGSLLKYSASEARQHKSVCIAELKEKGSLSVRLETIPPLHELRQVEGPIDELLAACPENGCTDYLFAKLTDKGEILDPMNRLRTVYPNILGLSFDRENEEGDTVCLQADKLESRPPETLFAEFFEKMTGEPPNDAEQALVAEVCREAAVWQARQPEEEGASRQS